MTEERVAILDDSGTVVGAAPRSVVRRDNLLHGGTAVLVLDPAGRVYVHRRADTKDVYPGLHDCWAGGVLAAGETPEEGARRELGEELGVVGVPLEPLFTMRYEDEHTRYVGFFYAVAYDGRITHQESEVAWGSWLTVDELRQRLADLSWPFVPDGRVGIERWLAMQAERS